METDGGLLRVAIGTGTLLGHWSPMEKCCTIGVVRLIG